MEHTPKTKQRSFQLTKEESCLFAFLLEVQSHFCPHVILRVAGGWVRDKVLGGKSNDIDICMNTMGKNFCGVC